MAFVSVADLDAYLGSTDAASYEASYKQTAVDVACAAIESYCDRAFAAEDYRQWYKGQQGRSGLLLRQYPLLAVRRVAIGTTAVGTLANSSTDAVTASGAIANGLLRLSVVGGTNAHDSSLTLASYTTLALLAAAVTALGKGWTLTVTGEESPRALREESFSDLTGGSTATLNGPGTTTAADIDYRSAAVLTPMAGDIYIDYRAGYEAIPSDLVGAALGLARDWLVSGTGTPAASEESKRLGDFTHTVKYSGVTGMLDSYKPILDNYRRLDWGIL